MTDLLTPLKGSYFFLTFGVLSIAAASIFACIGKVWVRFKGWVYRGKNPGWFWWNIALFYLVGICFIGFFFQ